MVLFPNLLSYMKQGNVIFITEFVIQGLSLGNSYSTFCNIFGFGVIFLTATILPNVHNILLSVITSLMELSHYHVCCLHLPFFDQPQTVFVAERTLSLKCFHMSSMLSGLSVL